MKGNIYLTPILHTLSPPFTESVIKSVQRGFWLCVGIPDTFFGAKSFLILDDVTYKVLSAKMVDIYLKADFENLIFPFRESAAESVKRKICLYVEILKSFFMGNLSRSLI